MTKRESQFLLLPLSGGVVDNASRKEGWSREKGIFSVPEFRPLRKHFGEGGVRRTLHLRKGGSDRVRLGVEPCASLVGPPFLPPCVLNGCLE